MNIRQEIKQLVARERKSNAEVIRKLREIRDSKLHLDWGFSSLFEYCTKELRYSPGAAARRVGAVELSARVKNLDSEIESGELSLNQAQKVNQFLKQEKYKAGVIYSSQETRMLVDEIKNKSTDEAERFLAAKSQITEKPISEKKRMMASGQLHVHLSYSAGLQSKIKRAKEILSSKNPVLTDAELLEFLLDDFLKRKDPLKKPERQESKPQRKRNARCTAEPQRTKTRVRKAIPASIQRKVWLRDNGCCQYRDSDSGNQCGSKYRVQIDHIEHFAFGGTNEFQNLRLLCQKHNLYEAEKLGIRVFSGALESLRNCRQPQDSLFSELRSNEAHTFRPCQRA